MVKHGQVFDGLSNKTMLNTVYYTVFTLALLAVPGQPRSLQPGPMPY